MTLAPTHFTLQGILLWQLMKNDDKEHFLRNEPWLIILLNLIANLPDLDDRIGLHRGPVHSLLLVLVMLLTTGVLYRIYKKKNPTSNGAVPRRFRTVIYAEVMWLMHIFLDMNTPLALFWPLTDQVYTVNFLLLISIYPLTILGIAFLPYEILGLALDVQTESFLAGLKFYLTNLTIEERKQIFQTEILHLVILDFIIHVLVAIAWIFIVGRPLTKALWKKYMEKQWKKWNALHWKKFLESFTGNIHWEWALLLMLISFSGLILTTGSSPQKQISRSLQEELAITNSEFSPLYVFTYERPFQLLPPRHPDVEIKFNLQHQNLTNSSYQLWLFLLPFSVLQQLTTELTLLHESFTSNRSNFPETFQSNYEFILNKYITENNKIITINEGTARTPNVSGSFVPSLPEKIFSFGLIIGSWSSPLNGSILNVRVSMMFGFTIIQHQEGLYYFGKFLQATGFFSAVIFFPILPLVQSSRKLWKAKKMKEDDDEDPLP